MSNLFLTNLTTTANNALIDQIAFGNTSNAVSINSNGVINYAEEAINLVTNFSFNNNTMSPAGPSIPIAINAGINIGGINGGIVNTQIFTANGTWTKPAGLTGAEQVFIMMWGAGAQMVGGGASSFRGGGGGACFLTTVPFNAFTNTCNVIVGGGDGANGSYTNNNNSTFVCNSTVTFFAGGGSNGNTTGSLYGGGGGWVSAGSNDYGGQPKGGLWQDGPSTANLQSAVCSIYGGGGSLSAVAGASIFGGGSGGSGTAAQGHSIFGGAAGGSNSVTLGFSVFGGDAGEIPGGGGWNTSFLGGTTYYGGRGEVRVWILGSRTPAVSLTYIDTTTSTSNTIALSTFANTGDIVVFSDRMQNTHATGLGDVTVTPSGFTKILSGNTGSNPSYAWGLFYKQLETSDLNTSITGMSGYTSMRKTLSVFRPSRTAETITAVSAGISATSATPTARTISANTNKPWEGAILAIGYWDGSAATSPTVNTGSVEMTVMNGPAANTVLEYKIYQQGDDVTRDVITLNTNDTGAMTALAGFYLKVT